MSKLIESLKDKTRFVVQPMGFRSSAAKSKAEISLIVGISAEAKNVPEKITGADAILITVENVKQGFELPQDLTKAISSLPWGLRLQEPPINESAKGAGPDFVVFAPDIPLFQIPSGMGLIPEIDLSIEDGTLRGFEDLPVDAVLVSEEPEILSWRFLAQLQRIDMMLSKFILVQVSPFIDAAEMQMLWQAGVDGILIGQPAEGSIQGLRNLIEKTKFPLPRRAKKNGVVIPTIPSQLTAPKEQEEGEEEEEE